MASANYQGTYLDISTYKPIVTSVGTDSAGNIYNQKSQAFFKKISTSGSDFNFGSIYYIVIGL